MDSPMSSKDKTKEEAGGNDTEDGISNKPISTDDGNSKDDCVHEEKAIEMKETIKNDNENNYVQPKPTDETGELPGTVETEENLNYDEKLKDSYSTGRAKAKVEEANAVTKISDEERFKKDNEVTRKEYISTVASETNIEPEDGNNQPNSNSSNVSEKTEDIEKKGIPEDRDKITDKGSITTAATKTDRKEDGEFHQEISLTLSNNLQNPIEEDSSLLENLHRNDKEIETNVDLKSEVENKTCDEKLDKDNTKEASMSVDTNDRIECIKNDNIESHSNTESELKPSKNQDNRSQKSDSIIEDSSHKNDNGRLMDEQANRKSSQISVLKGRSLVLNDKESKSSKTSISKEKEVDQSEGGQLAISQEMFVDESDEGRIASETTENENKKGIEIDGNEGIASVKKSSQIENISNITEMTSEDKKSEQIVTEEIITQEMPEDSNNGIGAYNESETVGDVKPEEPKKDEIREKTENAEILKKNDNEQEKDKKLHPGLEDGEVTKSSPRGENSHTSLHSTSEKSHTSAHKSSSIEDNKSQATNHLQREAITEELGHESDDSKSTHGGQEGSAESKPDERPLEEQNDGGGGDQETADADRGQNENVAAEDRNDEAGRNTVDFIQIVGTYVLGPTLDELIVDLIDVFGTLCNTFPNH